MWRRDWNLNLKLRKKLLKKDQQSNENGFEIRRKIQMVVSALNIYGCVVGRRREPERPAFLDPTKSLCLPLSLSPAKWNLSLTVSPLSLLSLPLLLSFANITERERGAGKKEKEKEKSLEKRKRPKKTCKVLIFNFAEAAVILKWGSLLKTPWIS